MIYRRILILAICVVTASAEAYAAAFITATEETGGVIFHGFGSLNTSVLNLFSNAGVANSSGLFGTPPVVEVGPLSSSVALYTDDSLVGPSSIGPLDSFRLSDRGEGDFFGITFLLPVSLATPTVIVPNDYVSGSELSGSAEYDGESFETLGIAPGIYTWNWGAAGSTDSLTVRIGIPEPATVVLVQVCAILMFACRKRPRF